MNRFTFCNKDHYTCDNFYIKSYNISHQTKTVNWLKNNPKGKNIALRNALKALDGLCSVDILLGVFLTFYQIFDNDEHQDSV